MVTEALRTVEEGDGRAVVLLHGFTGSTATMAGLAEALRSRGCRTVRVDLPGHGRSTGSAEPADYALDRVTDRLAATIAGLTRPVDLLGYSMGGRVALAYALDRTSDLRTLVLIGASAGLADPAERSERRAADDALAQRILDEGLEAFVDRWMAQPLFASQERLGPQHRRAARAQRLDNDPAALAACLRGLGTGSQLALHERLPSLALPVAVVTGERDEKFSAVAEEMVTSLPDAVHIAVEGVGHAPHVEAPLATADALGAFFASRP
jgi:2-succinyl-6-hydroxy-2,4-cyclohexadiene-1-carboxylate synthase